MSGRWRGPPPVSTIVGVPSIFRSFMYNYTRQFIFGDRLPVQFGRRAASHRVLEILENVDMELKYVFVPSEPASDSIA